MIQVALRVQWVHTPTLTVLIWPTVDGQLNPNHMSLESGWLDAILDAKAEGVPFALSCL